jgi:hypothetical protein
MKETRLTALLLVPLLLMACSGGNKVIIQSDVTSLEVGEDVSGTKILIASSESDFKIEVARRIGEALQDKPVYVKFIGTDQLAGEDASKYSAIIVMARCVTWGLDKSTEAFLKENAGLTSMVVLFTSGGGDWNPDMEGLKFDAVTSASVLATAGSVADEILEKVYVILDTKP